MRRRKYRINEVPPKKFFKMEYVAEKIIGVVILMILATIISTVLAFKIVFVWTYHPTPDTSQTTSIVPINSSQ